MTNLLIDSGVDKLEAGPETDALVAEKVMGWHNCNISKDIEYSIPDKNGKGFKRYIKYGIGEPSDLDQSCWYTQAFIPHFSTDVAVTWEMEEMIEQRGLNLRYAQALMAVLLFDGLEPECDEELWWALIHASPYQRCRAALKAVEDCGEINEQKNQS